MVTWVGVCGLEGGDGELRRAWGVLQHRHVAEAPAGDEGGVGECYCAAAAA